MPPPAPFTHSVLVVGSGTVGLALAARLSRIFAGSPLKVGLIDPAPAPKPYAPSPTPDLRTYALSPSSLSTLSAAGLPSACLPPFDLPSRSTAYAGMQVWDSGSPAFVKFQAEDIGLPSLGTIVEDSLVTSALYETVLKTSPNVDLLHGQPMSAALITTIKVPASFPERGRKVAFQRMFPAGPLALLPVFGDYYSVVWSTTPKHFDELRALDPAAFLDALNAAISPGPALPPDLVPPHVSASLPGPLRGLSVGASELLKMAASGLSLAAMNELDPSAGSFLSPPAAAELAGPRVGFDLKVQNASSYVSGRVALVGDAAHSVHPMAGQGLNLGLGDVECVSRLVEEALATGMDLGDPYLLARYDAERQKHVRLVAGGIHALHGAFGVEAGAGVLFRSLGMSAVNLVGPVKRRIARVAAGL
ncbi:hypothetical protein TeGR_g2280 [Tetraparma gracilis]|uniref:FAD-binding domain-containing protein n=1 Tax=Tetraparma gracilis TaxID=2962635 RepID=A0ABQ6N510_9STRA|nr:hypothetical protein TeGR_g2280 [Tetraparma gracilis]